MAYIPTKLIGTNSMAGFRRELKKILKCIVVSTASDMTPEQINEDFVALEGRAIPYSALSCWTLQEYIESLEDTFTVDPSTGIVSLVEMPGINKSKHIRKFVVQEGTSNNYRDPFLPLNTPAKVLPHWTIMDIINQSPVFSFDDQMQVAVLFNRNKGVMSFDKFEIEMSKILNVRSMKTTYGGFERILEKLSHILYVSGGQIYSDLSIYSIDVKHLGLDPYYVPNNAVIPLSVIDDILKLLVNESHGIWSHHLVDVYEKAYGYPLDYWTFGFPTVTQMLATLPHIFRLRLFDRKYRLFDMRKRDPAVPGVPLRDVKQVLSLLARFVEGIDVTYFNCIYYVMYGNHFDFEPMGFPGVVEALATLVNDGVILERVGYETVVKLKTRTMARIIPIVRPFLSLKIADSMPREWYPSSVLRPGDIVPRNRLMEIDLKAENGFGITLTGLYSPAQMFGTLTNGYGKTLEERLNNFYTEFAPRLVMPFNAAVPGLFCVGMFGGKYERVLITGLSHAPENVDVLFIDKGDLNMVDGSSLFYLDKTFGDIPNQAFLCYIPEMKPNDDTLYFTEEACNMFISLVKNKTLLAKVLKLNFNNMEAGLQLIDVTDGACIDVKTVMLEGWYGLVTYKKPKFAGHHYAAWSLYTRLVF